MIATEQQLGSKNDVLGKTLDYALLYYQLGFSVFPLRYKDKKPAIKTWRPYQEKPPTREEIETWFNGKKRNIAIVTGRVSNLVVIDFDDRDAFKRFLEKLERKGSKKLRASLADTWIVETGRGYHIYVRLGDLELVPRTKPRLGEGLDIKAEGGYVVAPPSIHPNGKQYRFAVGKEKVYGPPEISEPITLTEKEWKELLRLLGEERKGEKHVKIDGKTIRHLNDNQIHNIIDILKPYYVKGWRNYVVHYLLGALVKNNISYESSYKLIETLCDITNDEEKKQRLYLVEYHYGKRVEDIGIEKLKGYLGLRDVIIKQLVEKGLDHEDAQDQALEVINKLNEILGIPIERRLILVPIKTGISFQAYCNDPMRGILILTRNSKGVGREYILGYYIEKVAVLVNPSDKNDRSYTLILRHPKTRDTLTYQEESISSIVSNLENTKHGVRNPRKLKGALSSLIEAFVIRGLAEIKNKIPATGFFEVDGKLLWFESHRFKTNLGRPDKEKTIEALRKLGELLQFYRYSDKALAGLYFGIQAPLGFIRKKYGRENKILFHYGESHVGKTLLMKIIGYIWGLGENQSIIGAAKITAPQLAEKMNNTTLPITLDEVRTALNQPDIVDMIKNSTTNIHIKSRIRPRLGYKIEEFYAHASIAMTTNYVPQLLPGLEERLIPVEWTVEDKRNEKEVEEFLEKMAKYKDELVHIGSYLRDMFIRRWGEIKEIIMELDQLSIGKKLLEMMYEELGYDKPEWLRDIVVKYEIETPTSEEIFFDVIRNDLIDAVRKANIVLETREDGSFSKLELPRLGWEERIRKLGELGFLPSYMVLGRKNVYIKTTIIEHIRRKTGYEISGGLKNLALKLGYKYGPKQKVGKCMWIPIADLVEKMIQEVEDEEQ